MPTRRFLRAFELDYTVVDIDDVAVTVKLRLPRPLGPVKLADFSLNPENLEETVEIDRMHGIGILTGYRVSVTVSLDLRQSLIRFEAHGEAKIESRDVAGSPWHLQRTLPYWWPIPKSRRIGTADIAHVVVVVMENRSFDNLAGWLYSEENPPAKNIPQQDPPTFNGLRGGTYWNPKSRKYVDKPDAEVPRDERIYASCGASCMTVPATDPHEQFRYMNYQLFGKKVPKAGDPETMKGFVVDFGAAVDEARDKTEPAQIMQSYSPAQVPVLTALARNFAICDRWFASAPCQTWPNRGFVHAGTSCGRVNNLDRDKDDNTPPWPFYYDTRTVFNVMHELRKSWRVYGDSAFPTLTRYQFLTQLWSPLLDGHFRSFRHFQADASKGRLPAYSFIEPDFMLKRNDEHPPHDVRAGEQFLYSVWKAVSTGPAWEKTLLIMTFDEHGGCYDHVAPPQNAIQPDNSKPQKQDFRFERYGVRVPTIVISPFIEAGTVFRAGPGTAEYDHTSILATLRDWQCLDRSKKWLKSKRIAAAPTLGAVLTRSKPRRALPEIPKPPRGRARVPRDIRLNVIQRGVLAAALMGPVATRERYVKAAERVSRLNSVEEAVTLVRKMT